MDPIKEAFKRIKEDISYLRDEIVEIKMKLDGQNLQKQTTPTDNSLKTLTPTDRQTDQHSSDIQLNQKEPLFSQKINDNSKSSIGNDGVPTDRQTDQQTDRHSQNTLQNNQNNRLDPISEFKQANEIMDSLDSIKKGIRLKFKSLTGQEMLVFSTLYGLEEQNNSQTTYKTLAKELKLSESSIRDYINKLTKKGVPIDKIRLNNKTVLLKISKDLKNVATLATIMRLRDL